MGVIEVKFGKIGVEDTKKFVKKVNKLGLKAPKILVSKNKIKHENIISINFEDILKIVSNPKILEKVGIKIGLEKTRESFRNSFSPPNYHN